MLLNEREVLRRRQLQLVGKVLARLRGKDTELVFLHQADGALAEAEEKMKRFINVECTFLSFQFGFYDFCDKLKLLF